MSRDGTHISTIEEVAALVDEVKVLHEKHRAQGGPVEPPCSLYAAAHAVEMSGATVQTHAEIDHTPASPWRRVEELRPHDGVWFDGLWWVTDGENVEKAEPRPKGWRNELHLPLDWTPTHMAEILPPPLPAPPQGGDDE